MNSIVQNLNYLAFATTGAWVEAYISIFIHAFYQGVPIESLFTPEYKKIPVQWKIYEG